MQSTTPHRDAVEVSLAEMRRRYETLPLATHPADAHSRALTLELTEIVIRRLGDIDDAKGDREAFAQGLTHALGNVIASVASCLTYDEQQAMQAQARNLCIALTARALMRVDDPTRGMVVVHSVDVGGGL